MKDHDPNGIEADERIALYTFYDIRDKIVSYEDVKNDIYGNKSLTRERQDRFMKFIDAKLNETKSN